MSELRAAAIISTPPTAWERWRLVHPYWRLRQLGVDVRCVELTDRNGNHGAEFRRGELVVMPRVTVNPEHGRNAVLDWLAGIRRYASAIVYESDDDIWTDGFTEHVATSRVRQGLTDRQLEQQRKDNRWYVRQCDAVTVSSEPLAEVVRGFCDRPVYVVPNAIDLRWFRAMLPPKAPWADVLTIGWAGSRRPERDLAQMAEAWGRIARRFPDVRFVVAAAGLPNFLVRAVGDESRLIYLPWQDWEDYPRGYQVDIGCCAVADTPFTRAKTPIKAWEYAAAGAAVVATPTLYGPCMSDAFEMVAETADEWEHCLAWLIEHRALREIYADTMRQHVTEHHALDTQATRWPEAYAAILARGSSD